jgi:hypothetical protein
MGGEKRAQCRCGGETMPMWRREKEGSQRMAKCRQQAGESTFCGTTTVISPLSFAAQTSERHAVMMTVGPATSSW